MPGGGGFAELVVYEGEGFALGAEDTRYLRGLLRGNLELHAAGVCVRRLVGHTVLPSGSVLRVRSRKTSARSILSWVAYCDPGLQVLQLLPPAEDAAEPGDLAALAASLYAREVLRAAGAHGLARAYLRQPVASSVVRGRIDFAQEARARGDRAANRWLAEAARIIGRDEVMRAACPAELPRLRALFDGIGPLGAAERSAGPPRPPRHLVHLETALALASLLVRSAHLDEGAGERGTSYFVNLESLFEATVIRAFHESGIPCSTQHPARYQLERPAGLTWVPMHIDLYCPTLAGGLVIDAKYKSRVSPGNLQQMVTYCHLTGARMAVLVFPAGQLTSPARYTFRAPHGPSVEILTAELQTCASRPADWRHFGREVVSDVLARAEWRSLRG
jgi:5-methylcytosine-specific restriction endonuclease McrBC regulatory subunit McrC